MGNILARLHGLFSGFSRPQRILMLGLDAAGKTTVLYKLKLGERVNAVPTIGFNCESVQYKNIDMTIWDVGGQAKIRPLWRHYFIGTDALIYVVDSSDVERISESAEELQALLQAPELDDAVVLVYANKQDLPHAKGASTLVESFNLNRQRHRKWFIQPAVACDGEGLYEGLDWLSNALKETRKQRA